MIAAIGTIGALLLSAGILLIGNGLQGTLITVRAGLESFSEPQIGLLVSGYFAGYIAGSLFAPTLIMRAGHIRAFAAIAAIASATALFYALVLDPLVWIVLRVVMGFCICGLYMVIESWLNERTPSETRGRVFSLYRIIDLGSNMAGQLLLTVADPMGFPLFCFVSILICLSLVPVAMTRAITPPPLQGARIRLLKLYRTSPLGLAGSFAVGLANGAFWGLAPIFVQGAGHSVDTVAYFMSLTVLGGAVFQWPIGYASDRFDRRKVLILNTFVAVGLGAAMAVFWSAPVPVLLGLALFYGGAIMPIYSLSVAHANDHVAATDFVEASGGLLLVFGVGATIGPYAASFAMQHLGGWALFAHTAAVHGLLGLFGLYRMTRRPSVPVAEQESFVSVPRTSPAIVELDPRGEPEPALEPAAES
jgi:MFS family permease